MNKRRIITVTGIIVIVIAIILIGYSLFKPKNSTTNTANNSSEASLQKSEAPQQAANNTSNKTNDETLLSPSYTELNNKQVVDWTKPTAKQYPDLDNVPASQLKIVINQQTQTLSIYQNNKLVEEFLVSTGHDDTPTPTGQFKLQSEHGTWFYNDSPSVAEGARNWISFKDHGVYLIHSVVMDKNNQPIMSRQGFLGQKNSHGCVQMSLPDNQWFYDTFSQADKVGTPVVIE